MRALHRLWKVGRRSHHLIPRQRRRLTDIAEPYPQSSCRHQHTKPKRTLTWPQPTSFTFITRTTADFSTAATVGAPSPPPSAATADCDHSDMLHLPHHGTTVPAIRYHEHRHHRVPSQSRHCMPPTVTARKAIEETVHSGDRIFVHSVAQAPLALLDALALHGKCLKDCEVCHLHTETPDNREPAYASMPDSFKVNALFLGSNMRQASREHRAQYLPVFLSEAPMLFRDDILPLDVALVMVSPPDAHGYCSLGVSVDISRAAVECARTVVALVNPLAPRTHGDSLIHVSQFDYLVEGEQALPQLVSPRPTKLELRIGKAVAELVRDGACLQMGIGRIPNAVLACLDGHSRLGIHSEMISDGILPLIESGVVTGENKLSHPGKVCTAFALGTKALYDAMHDNPAFMVLDAAYINDVRHIAVNPGVVAINSAVEIDLSGQVCADSIGPRVISGVGGQMDFIRGASMSQNGRPIIAVESRTKHGTPRIVPMLREGAGVVTTRAHMRYLVTEYGVADLRGLNMRQRATAIIELAHPDDREHLERWAHEQYGSAWRR